MRRLLPLTLVAVALLPASAGAAPGDLDPTFGGGDGVTQATPGSDAGLFALELDGTRIVGAGSAQVVECDRVALARWLGDGTPDAAFGGGGAHTAVTGPCETEVDGRERAQRHNASAVALDVAPDGRIVTAGSALDSDNGFGLYDDRAIVTAHTAQGPLDPTFSGDGFLTDGFLHGTATGVVRLGDGRILVGGWNYGIGYNSWEIHRYLPTGEPDPSFDGDGRKAYPWIVEGHQEQLYGLVADGSDGAAVAVGYANRHDEENNHLAGAAIGRILADGSLDPAFGTNGRTRVEPGGDEAQLFDVVRAPGGDLVAVGRRWKGEEAFWVVLRFSPTGGYEGEIAGDAPWGPPKGTARSIVVDSAGRFVIGGESGPGGYVMRLDADGDIDNSFGPDGLGMAPVPFDGVEVAVQPDGRILAGGTAERCGRNVMLVARLIAEGAVAGAADEPGCPPDEEEGDGDGDGGGDGDGDQPPSSPTGSAATEGELGAEAHAPPPPPPAIPFAAADSLQSSGEVTIRILGSRVTKRGVLVRVTYPSGTEGTARARLWTRNKGVLLGQRTVVVLKGTTSRRFRVPLNRRAKRMLRSGKRLKIRATVRVTGLPARR
ncbi:MAG TPA: hypothetical protein VF587_03870 [Solirubrobacteraceae bacterium]